jgi:hypothetical protein
MSKKAIEILKSKMTLEERKLFVENCKEQNGLLCQNKMTPIALINILGMFNPGNSFSWVETKQGDAYWFEIYKRFTHEELSTPINFEEL